MRIAVEHLSDQGQAESFSPPEHRDRIFALILMGTLCDPDSFLPG